MRQEKLLPVENGKLGLRQSEALFQHVRQLPDLASLLFRYTDTFVWDWGIYTAQETKRTPICLVFWQGNLKPEH